MLFLRHNFRKEIFKKNIKLDVQLKISPAKQD